MWMNITIVREAPPTLARIVELSDTEAFRSLLLNAQGFRAHYSVTNAENQGEGYSVSIWDSAENGRAFFASPEYAQLLVDYKDLITNPPQRLQFGVNWEILHPDLLQVV